MENLVNNLEEITRARNAMLSQGARCAEHVLGITVDVSCPGAIDTETCPRFIELEDRVKELSEDFSKIANDRHSYSNVVE